MNEREVDLAKAAELNTKEAELDKALAALTAGVDRLKKKAALARELGKYSRKKLEETPPSGFDMRRLKKTRMVFMAMAEESLKDSQDGEERKVSPSKKGELTKIETRPSARPAPRPQPRSGS
jgi:hypothetical protein